MTSDKPKINWGLMLLILGFITSIIGLMADLTQLENISENSQNILRTILIIIAFITTPIVLVEVIRLHYQSLLQIKKIKHKLRRHLNFGGNLNENEINLIVQCRKAVKHKLKIKKIQKLDEFPPGTVRDALEIILDKGLKDGLISGMSVTVHESHNTNPLCQVELLTLGEPVQPNVPIGRLWFNETHLAFPIQPNWVLNTNNLRKDSFHIILLEPNPQNPLSQLFSDFIYDIEKRWSIREIILDLLKR